MEQNGRLCRIPTYADDIIILKSYSQDTKTGTYQRPYNK